MINKEAYFKHNNLINTTITIFKNKNNPGQSAFDWETIFNIPEQAYPSLNRPNKFSEEINLQL